MNTSFIITNDRSISLFVEGKSFIISPSHVNHSAIIESLRKKEGGKKILRLANATASAKKYLGRNVKIRNGEFFFKGKRVANALTTKIIDMMQQDMPFKPMIRFFELCRANPNPQSVEELYDFLEKLGITLTDRGTFLAWKSVRMDYLDAHSGKHKNTVGKILKMPRKKVDGDRNVGCSFGFHVGTQGYAETFRPGNQRIMVCEVSPEHVVSVPHDCSHAKLRVCQYKVVAEVTDLSNLAQRKLEEFRDENPDDVYDAEDDIYGDDV